MGRAELDRRAGVKTEEQAKQLWCPMARLNGIQGTSTNRSTAGRAPVDCYCIASECMMWEWELEPGEYKPDKGRCGLVKP